MENTGSRKDVRMVYLDEEIKSIESGKAYKGDALTHFVIYNQRYMVVSRNGILQSDYYYKVTEVINDVCIALGERHVCNFRNVTLVIVELVREE